MYCYINVQEKTHFLSCLFIVVVPGVIKYINNFCLFPTHARFLILSEKSSNIETHRKQLNAKLS